MQTGNNTTASAASLTDSPSLARTLVVYMWMSLNSALHRAITTWWSPTACHSVTCGRSSSRTRLTGRLEGPQAVNTPQHAVSISTRLAARCVS